MKQLIFFISLSVFVFANNIVNKQISLSLINTQSHELVYSPSTRKKLSELIWKADDIQLLGMQFDLLLPNSSFIQFSYKTNLSNNNAMMDDYDWIKNDTTQWSHWSNHPNTILNNFTIFDISFNNKLKSNSTIEKSIIVGYKVEKKDFQAYDGSYIYSSDDGFRDQEGSFSGLMITYEEIFNTLYLGFSAKTYFDYFIVSGKLTYSPIVEVTNKDTHHARYFTNNNTFDDTSMLSLEGQVEIPITSKVYCVLNYIKVEYDEASGTTTRNYYDGATKQTPGTVWVYSGAGISNSYDMLKIAIVGNF